MNATERRISILDALCLIEDCLNEVTVACHSRAIEERLIFLFESLTVHERRLYFSNCKDCEDKAFLYGFFIDSGLLDRDVLILLLEAELKRFGWDPNNGNSRYHSEWVTFLVRMFRAATSQVS